MNINKYLIANTSKIVYFKRNTDDEAKSLARRKMMDECRIIRG